MEQEELNALVGATVVIDTDTRFIYMGILEKVTRNFVELAAVDVHDCHDTSKTRELYVADTRRYGLKPNRERVLVRTDVIVSISKLEDVMPY